MAQVYGSVGYSNYSIDDYDGNIGAVTGRIGTHFNKYFGGELELGAGVNDASVTESGIDVDVKLKSEAAAYVVGFWPVNDNFELLGRLGYAAEQGEASAPGYNVTVDANGSGVVAGVGAQWFFTPHNGVRGDFTRDEAAGANVWSIAYAFRF
jgi:hypothetical protein